MANKYEHLKPKVESGIDPAVSERERAFMVARADREAPTLDFHGMYEGDVAYELDRFLEMQDEDCRYVRIIYGKGASVMRVAVDRRLKELARISNSRVEAFAGDTRTDAYVVLLKRG